MGRKEYFDDPAAPTPNSLVPAATVYVEDDRGRVLMIKRTDNGLWSLPGGAMEIGESISDCGERETLEETGYRVGVTGLIGIYSDPRTVIAYDDGEVRQQFAILLRGQLQAGAPATSPESAAVDWLEPDAIESTPMSDATRTRIAAGRRAAAEAEIS
jgi:8-oxo-dGTP pyrophosphatase MutT (NUDIX family)